MAIDVGLVIAQLVNFALLLLLLRRFLFQPVARVMEERARRIAEEMAEAERCRHEAEAERAASTEALASVPEERRRLLAQVERDAAALRERRLAELNAEVDRDRVRAEAERVHREHTCDLELTERVVPLLTRALTRAWRELADDDLGRAAQRGFLARVRSLDDAERAALGDAARAGPLHVFVAPAPTPEDAAALRDALAAVVAHPIDVVIDTDPDLIAGVRVRAGDLQLEWSARSHLRDLERTWRAALASGGEGEPWHATA